MGMQGPLTAQALGRSPYDDVVEGEGTENFRHPTQRYDHRGRAINPETKKMNRDIIRSHNEVMQVIGVAEPDHSASVPEIESHLRHEAYEEAIGMRIAGHASYYIETAGCIGLLGLRQRILIYKRYSHIPFWALYQQARGSYSLTNDILAGAPITFLIHYVDRFVVQYWFDGEDRWLARAVADEIWEYIRLHLELYATLQRVGLASNPLWLPSFKFFIPFSDLSPLPPLPALEGLGFNSLLRWFGSAAVSSAPFLGWVMAKRMLKHLSFELCADIFQKLPNTVFRGKRVMFPPAPQVAMPQEPQNSEPHENIGQAIVATDDSATMHGVVQLDTPEAHFSQQTLALPTQPPPAAIPLPPPPPPVRAVRRSSVISGRGDDSDGEENEGISATLISFDVEATESTDAPAGQWSAELRPSLASDSKSNLVPPPVYLDTLLTQLPALISSHGLGNAAARILTAPFEAITLRVICEEFCRRRELAYSNIHGITLLSGVNWTMAVNFFGIELLQLAVMGDIWAIFTGISQWYHLSEEQWKEEDSKVLADEARHFQ